MPVDKKRCSSRKKHRKIIDPYIKKTIILLIFCFPAGLLMMWSKGCRWSKAIKIAVTTFFCALVLAVILPQTLPPDREKSGVQVVNAEPVTGMHGPLQQKSDEGEYDVYIPAYVQPTSLIVEPTPTPIPIYVYCNDGGRCYHSAKCRYVKKTSARVPLTQALNAGYVRCKECNAPKEY